VLKYRKDIIFVARRKALAAIGAIVKDNGKGGPATEMGPDRSSRCAKKSDLETL
jgi:hypothetical protein